MSKQKYCPCQSGIIFVQCCEPFLTEAKSPSTAEQLMRSRYSAHVVINVDYLKKTLWPEQQKFFSAKEVLAWARDSEWLGLEILRKEQGGLFDQKGVVEFKARYKHFGVEEVHHEISDFRRGPDGNWYYVQRVDQ